MFEASKETELLYCGDRVEGIDLSTEALPIYTTTAFTWHSLDEVQEAYRGVARGDGFSYIRTINPNRSALGEAIAFLENGEASLICSSGMGAIASTLLTVVKAGDHVIYSNCCYGETLDIMRDLLAKFGVEVTPVNIDNFEEVKAAMRPNTKVIYSEVVANPLMKVADVPALAELIHGNGGVLIIDNTFTTPFAFRPLEHGADIVINSLTKFLNGHSDAMAGAVTSSAEWIARIKPVGMFCGTPSDPFSAWLVSRSLRTAQLRIPLQMANAAKIARALEKDPHVTAVYHPCIEGFSGHETALRLFENESRMCAMISFLAVSEDEAKRNEFMKRLRFAHYAPTLGGVRTTYQQPIYSSHAHVPDDIRRKAGITPAMFRISTGIENANDIIEDFTQALKAFD